MTELTDETELDNCNERIVFSKSMNDITVQAAQQKFAIFSKKPFGDFAQSRDTLILARQRHSDEDAFTAPGTQATPHLDSISGCGMFLLSSSGVSAFEFLNRTKAFTDLEVSCPNGFQLTLRASFYGNL